MYTIAGSLPMASAIILLPFYLAYLSTENFGALSIYLAFSAFVQILVAFSFDTSIYIHYHEFKKDKNKLAVFTSSVFVFVLVTGLVIGTVLTIAGDLVFRYLKDVVDVKGDISFYPFGLMAVGSAICQSIFKVYCSFLQTRQQPQVYFWGNLLSFTLIAGLTVAGLHLYPQTLYGPIGGRLIAFFLSAVWVCIMVLKEFGFHFHYATLKSSFSYNKASFIYQLQQWSITYLDRFVMMFFLPLSQIGIYDFAVKCMMGIDFVVGGLYNSIYPKVIGIITEQKEKKSTLEINRYYHGLIAAMMILVFGGVVFFTFIIDIGWVKKGYENSIRYFPLLGIIYLLRGLRYYFVSPYGVLKHVKPLPVIYLIISILKIAGVVLLIKQLGIYAVIIPTIITSIMEIVLLRHFIKHKFEFKFNYVKIIFAPAILMVALASSLLFNNTYHYFLYVYYPVVCMIVLVWSYRHEISQLNFSKLLQNRK